MTPAPPVTPASPPADPVRTALADERVRADLAAQARAVLNRWLRDRPAAERAEAAVTAVQEVARRALVKHADYDPAGAVAAWLSGILTHVLQETARELRRR